MKFAPCPTREEILAAFDVDLDAGILRWKDIDTKARRNPYAGRVAGCKSPHGYIVIRFKQRIFLAHRLLAVVAELDVTPDVEIDHINGIRDDNRKENLRLATRAENGRNTRRPTTNTTGAKGVSWSAPNRKWRARVKHNGSEVVIGYFQTVEDAASARRAYIERLHGEFANHG